MEIEGYPNYLIYDDGRVYSKRSNKFMKPCKNKYGYLVVNLSKNNKGKKIFIHRLIALYYIPNPDNKETVDHIDRNKLNNSISNLRWATMSEQMINRILPPSNTSEKYISKSKNGYYYINKNNCFSEYLNCSHYTLEDAIMLRDALLSMEDDIINHSI